MRLKNRLALVIVLFLSTFVGCYSLLLLLEVPERANVETDGALPWVISLLPGHVDTSLRGAAAQRQALATLVHGFDGIRHVRVVLRAPHGALLARASPPPQPAPPPRGARGGGGGGGGGGGCFARARTLAGQAGPVLAGREAGGAESRDTQERHGRQACVRLLRGDAGRQRRTH